MRWRTSLQLDERSKETLESGGVTFPRPFLGPNISSKHLKATLSLVFFPKSSGNTGAVSIKPERR